MKNFLELMDGFNEIMDQYTKQTNKQKIVFLHVEELQHTIQRNRRSFQRMEK